jgi:transposase
MEQLKMIENSKSAEATFGAFIGIDWADQQHAWAMQTLPDGTVLQGQLDHTPEAIEAWAIELGRRFSGQLIAVALEQSRGSLVFMLSKYAHLVLFPVHPTTLVKYRESFRPSGAKSDPSDAAFLLELLVHHRDKLRRLNPDTEETRTLQFLVEGRRKFVNEKTRYSNRLTDCLKMYYPQVLHWFCEVSSEIAGEFLQRWPTLEKLQKARPETLRKFFVHYHSAQSERVDCRLEEIRHAIAATKDPAVLTAGTSNTAALVRILRELRATIQDYDKQIETLARQHPEFALFDSFPGAGAALVPRLIAAMGTQRERYQNAGEVQSYSGIAPVVASSGKQFWVHWRWACPKFVRQTFHEWAGHSIRSCAWAKTHYEQQRAKGKSANSAIRSLAFKWIRILFRCWKDRQPYREELHNKSLARRSQVPASTVQLQWKTSAGFWKIDAAQA